MIIIVPVPTESDQGETRWQCLLVDKERRNQEVCRWALPQTKEQQQDPNKTLEWNIQKWEVITYVLSFVVCFDTNIIEI